MNFGGVVKRLFALFATFFVLGIFSPAQAGDFRSQSCSVQGRIVEIVTEDMNGDNLADLVVSYKKGTDRNAIAGIAVFFAQETGYPENPQIDFSLPKDSCLFDLEDIQGDGTTEFILFRKWKVQARTLSPEKAGEYVTLLNKGSGIMFPNAERNVPYEDLVRKWYTDGTVGLALPDYGSLQFYRADQDGKWVNAEKLKITARGDIRTSGTDRLGLAGFMIRSGVSIPSVFLGEPVGDNGTVFFSLKDEVWLHPGTKDGYSPKGRRFHFPVLTEKEKRDDNMGVRTMVDDLDNDGYPDAIVNKFGGSFRNFRSQVKLYKGTADGFAESASFTRDESGFTPTLRFWDVDGDNKKEMVLPTVKIGLTQMARMLISQSVKLKFQIFRYHDDTKIFGKDPEINKNITLKIQTEPYFRINGFMPDFSGDFDGDGLPDLFMAHGKGFGVWKNTGNLTFEKSPFMSQELKASETYRLLDLDQDNKCDMIIWDAITPETQGQVNILLNEH